MPEFSSFLWKLPGVHEFVRQAGHDLTQGINLLAVFPSKLELEGFRQLLLRHLEIERYLDLTILELNQSNGQSPLDYIKEVFYCSDKVWEIEQLILEPNLPDVILAQNVDNQGEYTLLQDEDWLRFIARWAEVGRSTGSYRTIALLTTAEQLRNTQIPSADVRLKYRLWVGIPSSLETRLLCRFQTNSLEPDSLWRETLLTSLAGNDLEILDLLWDVVFDSPETLKVKLRSYAQKKGWNKEDILKRMKNWKPSQPGQELRLTPKERDFHLLCERFILYTPEYGQELNPALAVLLDKDQEIDHRIWRAQASLLFPLLDDFRRRVCDHLTSVRGKDWAYINGKRMIPPVEMGELRSYLANLPAGDPEKGRWSNSVFEAWNARNNLAHYKFVTYDRFLHVWRVSQTLERVQYF